MKNNPMKKAIIYQQNSLAGVLEKSEGDGYQFTYAPEYHGAPVSLTMSLDKKNYHFDRFPSFLEGLLPEGELLQALLQRYKIDSTDYLTQLVTVGGDLVGVLTVRGE
ncbi:MAG: HipA N-terminal domain-containing protein [Chthoniobacterales bacterium]